MSRICAGAGYAASISKHHGVVSLMLPAPLPAGTVSPLEYGAVNGAITSILLGACVLGGVQGLSTTLTGGGVMLMANCARENVYRVAPLGVRFADLTLQTPAAVQAPVDVVEAARRKWKGNVRKRIGLMKAVLASTPELPPFPRTDDDE